MIQQAKNAVRHSIVRYNDREWMIETMYNKRGKCLLVPASDCGVPGLEISGTDEVVIIKYPAQLAMDYLNTK